eukprot:3083374-Rhodomonas_salina.7
MNQGRGRYFRWPTPRQKSSRSPSSDNSPRTTPTVPTQRLVLTLRMLLGYGLYWLCVGCDAVVCTGLGNTGRKVWSVAALLCVGRYQLLPAVSGTPVLTPAMVLPG